MQTWTSFDGTMHGALRPLLNGWKQGTCAGRYRLMDEWLKLDIAIRAIVILKYYSNKRPKRLVLCWEMAMRSEMQVWCIPFFSLRYGDTSDTSGQTCAGCWCQFPAVTFIQPSVCFWNWAAIAWTFKYSLWMFIAAISVSSSSSLDCLWFWDFHVSLFVVGKQIKFKKAWSNITPPSFSEWQATR